MSETKRPGAPHGGAEGKSQSPAEILENLIKGYVKTAALQNEYQTLHQSLPNVLSLAGEILKKKEESEKAYVQGLEVVEKVLADASQKADALSKAMSSQHEALAAILNDKDLLGEILKSGKAATAAAFEGVHPSGGAAAGGGLGGSGLGGFQAGAGLGNLGNAQVASQLNAAMDRIRAMIAQEVQRQAEILRGAPPTSGSRPN